MEFTVDTRPPTAIETEALVTYVFEQSDPVEGSIAELDQATGGAIRKLALSSELTGKALEMTLLHSPPGLKAQRLFLVGAGKGDKFTGAHLRKLAGAALRYLKARSVKHLVFLPRENDRTFVGAQTIVEGLVVANFESDKYKTENKNDKFVASVAIAGWNEATRAEAEEGIARGQIIGESQNFVRDLVNEPANHLTPRMLADRAQVMARQAGLACEVMDETKIAELKMGAILSVAQGSVEPPRLIVVTYTPPNGAPGRPVLGLIGKAITFDTGGISIKPALDMEKMKYDMTGGATMLGVMRALAALKPNVKVVAIVPSSENMPGGKAQKPGDVQISMAGKSIEVINTDAEGRLVLADGIAYAKQLGCTHLIDAATLTGAIVVALSNINVGVFGSDQAFTDKLLASAKFQGEKMWQMPLDDEYREMIKSTIADIQNVGSGKGGGAITAAMFLKEFAGDTPWIHLDIAGTAWLDEAKPWIAKGGSGIALRTLVDLVMSY
ncbi:MAG TPA: leucyl aminopeptidase [Candidatus Dormibacteraeota bacterium]|nr:leucyl aminopeptidase [Candidatus Dormibacteraeota bacterium]